MPRLVPCGHTRAMPDERPVERTTPLCRWRTSAETLDMIEALERIEVLLLRLDERIRQVTDQSSSPGEEKVRP
jgi:hypothetical protein